MAGSILLAGIAVAVLVIIIMVLKSAKAKKGDSEPGTKSTRGRYSIIKDAEKKLAHDPHKVQA